MTFAMPARPTTAITPSTGPAPVRFPVGRMAATLIGVGFGASVITGLIAGLATSSSDVQALALDTLVVLAGTVLGLAILVFSGPRPVFGWASLVLGSSMARLGTSLVLAFLVNLAIAPERPVFWSSFLAGSLAVLVVETIMARAALLKLSSEKAHTESA